MFQRRVEHGKIRDCHGDLRAGHIYFADGIKIIDCIEFNDRFRYADITSDLAFLAMDLDFEESPQTAQDLMNTYLEYTKDEEMLILLDFYKCYRAYVRVKVNCFHLQEERSLNECEVKAHQRNRTIFKTCLSICSPVYPADNLGGLRLARRG